MAPSAIDVIIPSQRRDHAFDCFESLKYLPFPFSLHLMMGDLYTKSVNRGLDQSTRDVLIMDDDALLLPETFKDFDRYYPHADIFGFRLLETKDGPVWHSGGLIAQKPDGFWTIEHRTDAGETPLYLGHLASAVLYLKRHVVESMRFAEDYIGNSCEDIDFSFRAVDKGFKLLYIPNSAIHGGTETRERAVYPLARQYLGNLDLYLRFPYIPKYGFVEPLVLDGKEDT
jgi:hypothetical protein